MKAQEMFELIICLFFIIVGILFEKILDWLFPLASSDLEFIYYLIILGLLILLAKYLVVKNNYIKFLFKINKLERILKK